MGETLREIIPDIQTKLKSGAFNSEEKVRLSLVARVLYALGWNIWNPSEVSSEHKATPEENNKKVDLTLFGTIGDASIFIEVKKGGKLMGDLKSVEKQMEGYISRFTAPFCILTDGEYWLLYYVYSAGSFSEKCFRTINLLNDDLDEVELAFETYLSKQSLSDGSAEREARIEKGLSQRQRIIRDSLPEARLLRDRDPDVSLTQALILATRKSNGLDISEDEARRCIQENPILTKVVISGGQKKEAARIGSERSTPRVPKAPAKKPVHLSIGVDFTKDIRSGREILTETAEWLIRAGKLSQGDPIIGLKRWANKLNFDQRTFGTKRIQHAQRLSNGLWIYNNFSADDCENWSRRLLDDSGFGERDLKVTWSKE